MKECHISMICELGEELHRSVELTHILRMILVAVTAGQGLGFNRAFLLLVDADGGKLEGKLAIGPSSHEEAGKIWSEIQDRQLTLSDLLESYTRSVEPLDVRVNELVTALRVPLFQDDHILVRAMREDRALNVWRDPQGVVHGIGEACEAAGLMDQLGVDALAAAPLLGDAGPLGVIVADNMITRAPIEDSRLSLLKTFANHAGIAITKARLQQELERKIDDLKKVNVALQVNQEKLLQSERLSTIGEMASVVAHEIRNPLVIIGGFARSALKRMDADDPNRESLEVIAAEVIRLEKLVTGVLGFARPAPPELTPTRLARLVEEAVGLLRKKCGECGIAVELDPGPELPEMRLDRDQIHQVLSNVMLNAVHAMPGGGRLSVAVRRKGGSARIRIGDTGTGIPREMRDRVFDPFFSTRNGGSGLGLAIARKIMKSHGGDIFFSSREGAGTTFYLDLPIQRSRKGVGDGGQEDPGRRGRKIPAAAL